MSKKRRVFQIARELSLSNEAVIEFLGKRDKSVRTQMSAVSDELYEEIRQEYKTDSTATVTDSGQDFRRQLKEKQMLEELRRNKARMELEERIRFATQLAEERPQRIRKAAKEEAEALKKREEPPVEEVKETAAPGEPKPSEEISVVELISRAKKEIDREKEKEKGKDKKKESPPVSTKREKTGAVEVEEEKKSGDSKKKSKVEVVAGELKEAAKGTKETPAEKEPAVAEEKPAEATKETEKEQKRKGKKRKKKKISEAEIQESIKQTLAAMEDVKHKRRKKRSKDVEDDVELEERKVIKVSEFISAAELAGHLNVDPGEVITKCVELGMMVSINQRLEMTVIEAVADEFGYEIEKIEEYGSEIVDKYAETEADEEAAISRPPVVTIMGHVDHGKTSLLDYIRKSNVMGGEAGGITQHIGAYEVSVNDKSVTFLDTPGHEAFTAMRARGAQLTDLVVLIVAADDGVQPQTVEAINHALAAGVPIVVAINKIDKPNANPDLVRQQLSENNILVEEWGGKYQSAEISAKSGEGVDKLLELILLEAEVLELKANPNRTARGIIIESKLDKGKGPVGTVLVQTGTLKVGDLFIAGQYSGKVRAMFNERKRKVTKAPPSTPVQVVGFDDVPQAGDPFLVMETEREVRELSSKRLQLRRERDFRSTKLVSLDQISQQIREGELKELNVILKADVDGSIEALSDAMMKLSNEEVSVNVIHKAVGGISESDVLFASASEAIIIGFHVRPTTQARELAKKEEIDIRLYDIIYDAVEDVKSALEGLLEPEITHELTSS
ncbi:MAG: translation initiation factor IF-2, partial [bacterium]